MGARCRRDDGLRNGSMCGGSGSRGYRARPLAYYGKAHRRQPSYRPRCGHGSYSYDRPGSHCLFRYLLPFQI